MSSTDYVAEKHLKSKCISVDIDRCIGCGICELICSFVKSGEKSFNPLYSRIHVTQINGENVAVACLMCEDAPCVKACPRNALTQSKENGIILVDESKCTGCGWCLIACNFGSIIFTEKGKVTTCDLCAGREKSRVFPGRPMTQQACIAWCPEEAISLVDKHRLSQKILLETIAKLRSPET
ncbi:MAG: 4Fe-4S dicluster domain-containing protein [Candidatus Bathyarchaeia archaeon]